MIELIYIAITASFMYMLYFGCVLIIGCLKSLVLNFYKEIILTVLIFLIS